jgi:LDH2 family malate/lactate/ureidoglycolate dehydrogenase
VRPKLPSGKREHGMASVGAYNSYYRGRNAYFVEKVVQEGFV